MIMVLFHTNLFIENNDFYSVFPLRSTNWVDYKSKIDTGRWYQELLYMTKQREKRSKGLKSSRLLLLRVQNYTFYILYILRGVNCIYHKLILKLLRAFGNSICFKPAKRLLDANFYFVYSYEHKTKTCT